MKIGVCLPYMKAGVTREDYLQWFRRIDEGRIETRGAGPNEPIADNETESGRAENRRIEVKILVH